jgi:hypothetical protein
VVWSKQGRAARTRRGVLNVIDISKLTPTQLERLLHMEGLIAGQKDQAAKVRSLRDYYDGIHPSMLTNRQEEIIGALLEGNEFPGWAYNISKSVVDVYCKRLNCTGLEVEGTDDKDDASPEAQVGAAMWGWWSKSRMDSQQARVHRRALRDGKTYVMTDYDPEKMRPRFTLHHVDAGEQDPGIILHRDPSDENRILYATRHFVTFNPLEPGETGIKRKTVYLPDQIRKYVLGKAGQWEQYADPGDVSWPLPWTDRNGKPIGIPVIEFAPSGGSVLTQIIPLQNALNKACLDLIGAADAAGFPMLGIEYDSSRLGARLTNIDADDADNEGDDEMRVSAQRMIEVDDGSIVRIAPGDLSQLVAFANWILQAVSGMANMPIYYLRPVGGSEVPSGESLKQLESALVAFIEELQLIFGQAWEDVFAVAYRVNQAFGPSLPELDEPSIRMTWQDANVRNDQVIATTAESHQRLGVPQATLWQMLGYTPEQIDEFKRAMLADTNAKVAGIAAMLRTDQSRQGGQQPGQPAQNGAAGRNGTGVQ